jgi:hypothetical protein
MQSVHIFAPNSAASVNRWRSVGTKLIVASFALFATSLASANGAPLHNNNHHHSPGGYVAADKPPASLSTGAWTTTTREPVEIFGRKVDP